MRRDVTPRLAEAKASDPKNVLVVDFRISPIGNSQGVRLSRDVLTAAGLERGDQVKVRAGEGRVVIEPAPDETYRKVATRLDLFRNRYRMTLDNLAK